LPIRGSYWVDDPDGTELPNDAAAREEALQVIRDLKKNQTELRWNGWVVEVTQRGRRVWQIPFFFAER